jgi:hypothetical protein
VAIFIGIFLAIVGMVILMFLAFNYFNWRTYLTFKPSRGEIVDFLQKLYESKINQFEYQKYTSAKIAHDLALEECRVKVLSLECEDYTVCKRESAWFNDKGLQKVKALKEGLERLDTPPKKDTKHLRSLIFQLILALVVSAVYCFSVYSFILKMT